MKIITLMDSVETVDGEIVKGMEGEHNEQETHEKEPEYDVYVWISPKKRTANQPENIRYTV